MKAERYRQDITEDRHPINIINRQSFNTAKEGKRDLLRQEGKKNMNAYKKTNTNRETDQDRQAEAGTDKSYNKTVWVDIHSAAQDRSLIHVTNSYLMLTAHMSRLPHNESLIILTTHPLTHLPATRPPSTHSSSHGLTAFFIQPLKGIIPSFNSN